MFAAPGIRAFRGWRPAGGAAASLVLGLALLTAACAERERLVFPSSLDNMGPTSVISDPSVDTVFTAGPNALVGGQVDDVDGISQVFFETEGGLTTFPPLTANGQQLIRFSLPITTGGLAGDTITVRVFAIDQAGLTGDTAIRRLFIQ